MFAVSHPFLRLSWLHELFQLLKKITDASLSIIEIFVVQLGKKLHMALITLHFLYQEVRLSFDQISFKNHDFIVGS